MSRARQLAHYMPPWQTLVDTDYNDYNDYRDSDLDLGQQTLVDTSRQIYHYSDLDSIRNSCDVFVEGDVSDDEGEEDVS